MSAARVSELDSVHDLLRHPQCVELIADTMGTAEVPESAEAFLEFSPLPARLGGAAGRKLAEDLGIQSQTKDAMALSQPYAYVMLALLRGLAKQGLSLTHLDEAGRAADCVVIAAIPSSALSWNGELLAHVTGDRAAYRMEATVTFKGQKFAWGRGKRILKRLFQDVERDVFGFEVELL